MKKILTVSLFLLGTIISAQAQKLSPSRQLAYDIFKQLIEINTTDSVGNCTEAVEAMTAHLKAAGFPDEDIKILGQIPANKIWSCVIMAQVRASRFCCSRTLMWSKLSAKTGRLIRSLFSNRTDIITGAARRMIKRWRRFLWRI